MNVVKLLLYLAKFIYVCSLYNVLFYVHNLVFTSKCTTETDKS